MKLPRLTTLVLALTLASCASHPPSLTPATPQLSPADVLSGLQHFYATTARPDGSFQNGVDPTYQGMSDSAYSDLAAVTYACTIHKTFGWTLPHEKQTANFLLARQKPTGDFVNLVGTVDPASAEGRTYNTTQGLVALHALGLKPTYNPLPVFEEILKADYKTLPAFSTSFFPLAYLCYGQPIPAKADRGIRALMIQDATGYTNNHIAATFHASHYYSLVNEPTPKSRQMVDRILREQNADGSWLLNMPSRDRHATFDAVFTLLHEGGDDPEVKAAIDRAAQWALSCRNPDGGFGHFPGSTSDADANYFQVGTLVMAGYLKPATDPAPADPHLLSWGHLMPLRHAKPGDPIRIETGSTWLAAVAFSHDGRLLAAGGASGRAHTYDPRTRQAQAQFNGHSNVVSAVAFSPDDKLLATGSYDHTAKIWDARTGKAKHKGAVTSVAFSPTDPLLATASIDGTIKLWNPTTGQLIRTLEGHKSWVNAITFEPQSPTLISGSSDGTVKVWATATGQCTRTIEAGNTEVRSIAISDDGKTIAAGLRYGTILRWRAGDTSNDAASGRSPWDRSADNTIIPAAPIKSLPGDAWAVAFAPDGKLIAGGGDWNQPGLVTLYTLPPNPSTTVAPTVQFNHTGEVLSLSINPHANQLAAAAGDGTIMIWQLPK
jgi:geranylgeranyl transferase type-2 subunit beta